MIEDIACPPGYRWDYIVDHESFYAKREGGTERTLTLIKAVVNEQGRADLSYALPVFDESQDAGGPSIRVEVFEDAFAAFIELRPLFHWLATARPTTLDEVRAALDRFGFTDVTMRTDPSAAAADPDPVGEALRAVVGAVDDLTPVGEYGAWVSLADVLKAVVDEAAKRGITVDIPPQPEIR